MGNCLGKESEKPAEKPSDQTQPNGYYSGTQNGIPAGHPSGIPTHPSKEPIGSRVNIQLQDPSVGIGLRTIYLPQVIQPGPRTTDIKVYLDNMGIKEVNPTAGNDYLYIPEDHPAEFDAINTLVTAQVMINFVRRCLRDMNDKTRLSWPGDLGEENPLKCYPWADERKSIVYSYCHQYYHLITISHALSTHHTIYRLLFLNKIKYDIEIFLH